MAVRPPLRPPRARGLRDGQRLRRAGRPGRLRRVAARVARAARSRLLDELATLDGDLVDDDEDFAAPEASKSASALAPETLFFEGPPSITELVWVKYKITSRRISVQSGLGGNDFTEIIYSDIVDLKYVYQGSKEDIYKYIYSLCSEECQATAASMK
ncbi:hypothetical protein SO694_0002825 [Aureococcus anophagefferens]|uniref:Uncharacterized protein n=1 Tax=Aureococcus anophagefferens TaxID=44056 RepID=A0ABR1FVN4_AURAN